MLQPVQMQCAACKVPVDVQIAPSRVLNYDHTSVVILEHSGQVACPNCNNVVRPVIIGLQGVAMVAMPVPPEEQQKVIAVAPRNGRVVLS